jgi:pimeloyl-ACP methyl ester carboxylesterase
MSVLHTENGTFHYELAGPQGAPVLLFSNSLGTDLTMWDLADDVVALLQKLEIAKIHFCGLSMGGMVGMSLAMHAPDRLGKLILCNTAPKIGTPEIWDARINTVRAGGMAAVVEGVLERWFTPDFRKSSPVSIQRTRNSRHSCTCLNHQRLARSGHATPRRALYGRENRRFSLQRATGGPSLQHRSGGRIYDGSSSLPERISEAAWTIASDTKKEWKCAEPCSEMNM